MFFVVRSNVSFNFPLGLIKYVVIVSFSLHPCSCPTSVLAFLQPSFCPSPTSVLAFLCSLVPAPLLSWLLCNLPSTGKSRDIVQWRVAHCVGRWWTWTGLHNNWRFRNGVFMTSLMSWRESTWFRRSPRITSNGGRSAKFRKRNVYC